MERPFRGRGRPLRAFFSPPPPSHLSCSSAWPSKRPDFHDLGLKEVETHAPFSPELFHINFSIGKTFVHMCTQESTPGKKRGGAPCLRGICCKNSLYFRRDERVLALKRRRRRSGIKAVRLRRGLEGRVNPNPRRAGSLGVRDRQRAPPRPDTTSDLSDGKTRHTRQTTGQPREGRTCVRSLRGILITRRPRSARRRR